MIKQVFQLNFGKRYLLKDNYNKNIIFVLMFIFVSILILMMVNYNFMYILLFFSPFLLYICYKYPEYFIVIMFTYGYLIPSGSNRNISGILLILGLYGFIIQILFSKNSLIYFAKSNILSKYLFFSFNLFFLWIFIRSINSEFLSISLEKFNKCFILIIIIYNFFALTNMTYKRLINIINFFGVVAFIMSMISFISFLISNSSFDRLTIYNNNPIGFSRYVMLVTILVSTLFFVKNEILNRKLSFILLNLLFIILILTNTKGVLLSSIISVFLTLLLFNKKIKKRYRIIYLMFFCFILILSFKLLPEYYLHRYINKTEIFSTGSYYNRLEMYNQSFNIWKNYKLYGSGFGTFFILSNTGYTYPHNIFLEIISETGLIGLILFLNFIISNIYAINKSIKAETSNNIIAYGMFLKTAFIAFLISAQFSGDIPGNNILFFISALIMKYVDYIQKKE